MQKLTRRRLIEQASLGVGAISVLAATIVTKTRFKASSTKSIQATEQSIHTSDEPVVIHITNSASGTLTVMRGERETTVHNVALVQQLLSL